LRERLASLPESTLSLGHGMRRWRRFAIGAFIPVFVIVPFVVAGDRFEVWSVQSLRSVAGHSGVVASIIVVLLAADVVLPIPSSVVSTSAGLLLGFGGGLAASAVGMTICAVVGYGLGRSAEPVARRFVGADEGEALDAALRRHGDWLIVMTRPVPVLAESTVILAGLGKVPLARFLCLAVLANIGVSAVYAFVGAFAADVNSFLLACVGALLLPVGPMIWLRRNTRRDRAAGG
jgi:uncharacterized membrane protein YdjX (TVP38/TMEM64 family)